MKLRRYYVQFPLAGGWQIGGPVLALSAEDAVTVAEREVARLAPQWWGVLADFGSAQVTEVPASA